MNSNKSNDKLENDKLEDISDDELLEASDDLVKVNLAACEEISK